MQRTIISGGAPGPAALDDLKGWLAISGPARRRAAVRDARHRRDPVRDLHPHAAAARRMPGATGGRSRLAGAERTAGARDHPASPRSRRITRRRRSPPRAYEIDIEADGTGPRPPAAPVTGAHHRGSLHRRTGTRLVRAARATEAGHRPHGGAWLARARRRRRGRRRNRPPPPSPRCGVPGGGCGWYDRGPQPARLRSPRGWRARRRCSPAPRSPAVVPGRAATRPRSGRSGDAEMETTLRRALIAWLAADPALAALNGVSEEAPPASSAPLARDRRQRLGRLVGQGPARARGADRARTANARPAGG